jgi:hypothetical protein
VASIGTTAEDAGERPAAEETLFVTATSGVLDPLQESS